MKLALKIAFCFTIFCLSFTFSHVFQLKQCNNFDAEFSKVTYGQRLLGEILLTLSSLSLRGCLTECMYHLGCLSVNYMREDSTCEILGNIIQRNIEQHVTVLTNQTGWNHFETNYDRKAIGITCSRSNPCPSDKRCVDNCDGLASCVPLTVEALHSYVQTATSSSFLDAARGPASAFDGNEGTMFHTDHLTTRHWIKAEFNNRVFIDYVVFVNRHDYFVYPQYAQRSDLIDLKTILAVNEQTTMTWFANTGDMGVRRIFSCMRQADGIYAEQPQVVGHNALNFQEIWIYGAVL